MSYDFAQIVKFGREEVRVMFTIESETRENGRNRKVLTGVDEMGNAFSGIGLDNCNNQTYATQVKHT